LSFAPIGFNENSQYCYLFIYSASLKSSTWTEVEGLELCALGINWSVVVLRYQMVNVSS